MHIISSLLFGLSANMDAFILGFSYGIKKLHIPVAVNIIISLITFAGTLLSIGLGMGIAAYIPISFTRYIGSGLLILLGLYYTVKSLLAQLASRNTDAASLSALSSTVLSRREAVSLGIILTLNNAGMGIGASFAGIPIIPTTFLTLLFSFSLLYLGNRIGIRCSPGFITKHADLISGLIMIVLGIYELII